MQENNQVAKAVESKTESNNQRFSQLLDPNQLVQQGGSTVAVILAIAFLIFALAEYNKVFIPVMMQRQVSPVEMVRSVDINSSMEGEGRQQPVLIYQYLQMEKRE